MGLQMVKTRNTRQAEQRYVVQARSHVVAESSGAGSLAADQQAQLTCRAGQLQRAGSKGGRRGGTEGCGLVVPNVSDPAGTAAQAARVADSCRRFRIDRAAQSTVLHRQAVEAGDWSVLHRAVRCSNGANGGGG